jgi:hypothetical protein
MKIIPVLFSTPMVQAILEESKTMTRRVVKSKTALEWLEPEMFTPAYVANPENNLCPYGKPGDVLWVRETWAQWNEGGYVYKADGFIERYGAWERDTPKKFHDVERVEKWKPSLFMPKTACRIFLEVTDVRVERLQDISEEDAIKEGILSYECEVIGRRYKDYLENAKGYGHPDHDYPTVGVAVTSFSTLWRKINGEQSWWDNPWVWAVSFKRISKPENFN